MPYPRTTLPPYTLWLAYASIVMGLLFAPTDASAAKKPVKAKNNVQHIGSSLDESRTERDRRLLRECKGRPDAGACLGYTRGK